MDLSRFVEYQTPLYEALRQNKSSACALSASYIATFAGYPLDSLKSRIQIRRMPISVLRLTGVVYNEEGIKGFFRGLWIPLISVSFIRATTFMIYDFSTQQFRKHDILNRESLADVALIGGIKGAISGSVIGLGNAPLELVKIRRQLEYNIAARKGIVLLRPPSTAEAIRDIVRTHGPTGLYLGFRLHFVRDAVGTALYFLKYDALRYYFGRNRSGEQGSTPSWLPPVHPALIPFMCGSIAGVTSWGITYPLDVVKTKLQQVALSGEAVPSARDTLRHLLQGTDPSHPQATKTGIRRIYRGLGLSSVRSIINHGLLWTFYDIVANYIDNLPKY